MKKKLKIGLFFGGTSPERKVSLRTGQTIARHLNTKKYDVIPIEIGLSGKWLIDSPTIRQIGREMRTKRAPTRELAPVDKNSRGTLDVALLALHGPGGEDGTLQGMLELLGIPYTCSGVLASALAMDKFRTKRLLAAAGIPVPPDVFFRKQDNPPPFLPHRWGGIKGGGIVIKPNKMGSSLGVTIVKDKKHFKKALAAAFKYDNELLVEPYLEGPEITVGVLGNRNPIALPTIEIIPWRKSAFYDYAAKYEEGGSEHLIPARLTPVQRKEVQDLAVTAHQTLGCRGVTRSDFILAPNGQFYFLEINTIPGMTPTSLVPQAAAAAGISFPQLLDKLIRLALET